MGLRPNVDTVGHEEDLVVLVRLVLVAQSRGYAVRKLCRRTTRADGESRRAAAHARSAGKTPRGVARSVGNTVVCAHLVKRHLLIPAQVVGRHKRGREHLHYFADPRALALLRGRLLLRQLLLPLRAQLRAEVKVARLCIQWDSALVCERRGGLDTRFE